MILFLEDGTQIRGDIIACAILRSDLAPVPMTLELDVRAGDGSIEPWLKVDRLLMTGEREKYRIIKSERAQSAQVQDGRERDVLRVTALLNACHPVAFVRKRAVIREDSTLLEIYRASDATVSSVVADFHVPRFYCHVGQSPAFQIVRALQEEGGVVRWKNARLEFIRLPDLFTQEPVATIPHTAAEEVESGFLERHSVPWWFSLNDSAGFVFGNRDKPRAARFAPFQNEMRLRNMSRCLIRRRTVKLPLNMTITAGDLFELADGQRLAVVTAAHVWQDAAAGADSGQTYTRIWLGELGE